MRSERQQRIEELFTQALDRPETEREKFLDESCGPDRELRGILEELLRSDAQAGPFLGRLADGAEDEEPLSWGELGPGRQLGSYRLVRQIGQGGMSTVFLAERVDGSFQRSVVVKVIRQGMESDETVRRSRLEQQILAGLEHPNIARLYDGGMTAERLPFFVMEWVEGMTIDAHCDRLRLGLEPRLKLFRKVCAAVQYAHQNLIVHRDLKPGNILVTPDGEPKLLDFGIAKLLDPVPMGSSTEPTLAWARRMTPNYASPEQIVGGRITTASDVYSLGVLLHKLLVGCLPRRLEGASALEIGAQFEAGPLPKPSDRLGGSAVEKAGGSDGLESSAEEVAALRDSRPDALRKLLQGDLDRIVLKALHPDPERRYSSAEQLGDDLGRHQQGLPVRARPDTWFYRMSKFVRRQRIAVAAVGLVMGILATSAAVLGWQSVEIARERDQLRAVVSFVKSVFDVAGEGEELTVRQAVDRSAVILDLGLREQPEIRATLLDITGTIYLKLLQAPPAHEQLAKAVELRGTVLGRDTVAYAESLSTLGVADALLDDFDAGETRAREAIAISEERLGSHHPKLVLLLNNLVSVLCYRGNYAAANEPSERSLALARETLGEERVEYGDAVAFRALVHTKAGDQERAEAYYREALRLHRRYRGERHPKVATVLNNLALALKRQGKLDEAEVFYRQALALERELFGNDHPEIALALNNLASLLRARGQLREAEATYREAIDLVKEVLGPGHSGALITSVGLALVLIEGGKARAAEVLLRDGLEQWTSNLADSWYVAYARSVLGESLMAQGDYTSAGPLLVSGYREIQAVLGDEAAKTKDARRRLDEFEKASGEPPPEISPGP